MRAGVKSILCLALWCALAFASPLRADDVITNIMSPVVSYQYQEALGTDANSPVMSPVVSYQYYNDLGSEALTNSGILSPIVSYQYFDSLGTNVSYQNSAPVSYFFNVPNGGNTFTLTGHVLDASGATVSGATVTASILETTQATATTAANGTYQIPALPQGVYVFSAAKSWLRAGPACGEFRGWFHATGFPARARCRAARRKPSPPYALPPTRIRGHRRQRAAVLRWNPIRGRHPADAAGPDQDDHRADSRLEFLAVGLGYKHGDRTRGQRIVTVREHRRLGLE